MAGAGCFFEKKICRPVKAGVRREAKMSKPQIDAGAGPAPEELVIEDLVVGDGAEAVSGGMVEVHYVGVDF